MMIHLMKRRRKRKSVRRKRKRNLKPNQPQRSRQAPHPKGPIPHQANKNRAIIKRNPTISNGPAHLIFLLPRQAVTNPVARNIRRSI
jgi:hypothetical protein